MLATRPKSTKADEYALSSEQVQKLLQVLNNLFVSAQANKDIRIILEQESDAFVDIVQDFHALEQRRNEKLRQLLEILGKKIVLMKLKKQDLYDSLKRMNEKLEKRETGIRRLSLQPSAEV